MSDVVFMIALLAVMLGSGCASRDARKHAEGIAKGWCMTIRASQVIPVYPLTADLRVGDVFLVQTPISVQDKQYREKGFLALDDHRCRLAYTNFGTVYFDGYWKDTFGKTPHPTTNTVFAGSAETNGPVTLTVADAPRVAFPTYSFQAQSGYGLSAAFPIEGVPVALSFLGTDRVNGSVTISDARTYAGDESELWQSLLRWASEAKPHLAATARNAVPTPVYLRVVTRVYLARAMDVSLIRADAKGGSVRAKVGSDVSLLNSDGTANAAYSNLLQVLNGPSGILAEATQFGGAAKFAAASSSTVGMKQKFDQLLAVGYVGFDVPVYENGTLGVPIPTFQRLAGGARAWVGPVLDSGESFRVLEHLVTNDPRRAYQVMKDTLAILQSREFRLIETKLNSREADSTDSAWISELEKDFGKATLQYFARYNLFRRPNPQRLRQFNDAFDQALSVRRDGSVVARSGGERQVE